VEDPREEQRRWRHRRAANRADGRNPTGAAEVEWAIEEPPQDQQAPGSHAKSVVAATLEYRRKCEARRRSEERRLKGRPEEDEQQLWENPEYPPTTRYAPEHCIPPPAVAEDWAPSPPRWLPEISPTPRYEVSPHWTPARKPTPRFEQSTPLQQPERQQQPQRERGQQQQPDPAQQQQGNPMGQHIRTDIPAAHVSHSTQTFVAEGVRGKVAAADGRLDLAGGTPGGDGGDGGAPNLRGGWSPGEPAAD